ncbi:haloacid dehalogenase-like hydrolase domain-containing protein 2 [Eurytemora carolleeae]|uniref:haloacid dehalogenase-like hydrolase domain-containing protein 2 n=1 Tax=Eurytemora carolleeae TaxID=1294199 RepID=UPI000C7776C9|nr:haloacid dehalogenase-like hydrolase domain-containing protein 2 [Eurytemora carolleeae]|eukprot:XP_023323346.1 haloacid dehalogenase-like hydrolase domain-containing protein 2 [Eurytemora affinis]
MFYMILTLNTHFFHYQECESFQIKRCQRKMKIKAVMIDLSGTVHVGTNLLPGAKEAIVKLKSAKVPIKYVTNTSKESKTSLIRRLKSAGLHIDKDEVFTSLSAARNYIISQNIRPLLLLEKEALEDFEGIETESPNSVVVGLAPTQFHYEKMNEAFNLIKSGGSLVAINKSRYYKSEKGLSIGTGAFVSALEFSTDCKAYVVGKPEKNFFHLALKDFMNDLKPIEVLVAGDDIRDDVLGAQKAGLQGALIKTGKYQEGDEDRFGEPNYLFENLEEMADYVIDQFSDP